MFTKDFRLNPTVLCFFLINILFLLFISSALASVPGVTPGKFSVDKSGAAHYAIDINVPPGRAGMQPSLSLSYSSQSGNGILGMGWTLGGLSAITRCPAVKAKDGIIDGVDFDSNDRFCLDGARLIAVSGTYGANGTVYRTEIDGFTLAVSSGVAGNGPEQFDVFTKSGQHLAYGQTADSRIEATGRSDVRVWAVSGVIDTVGNYMHFSYSEDTANSSYQIDRIDYSWNIVTGASNYASVQFSYEARPDIQPLYFGGTLARQLTRMTSIKTYVGTQLVKSYNIEYELHSFPEPSRLKTITECDAASLCFPPIQFTTNGNSQGTFPSASSLWMEHGGAFNLGMAKYADVNGDGRGDLIYQGVDNRFWVSLSVGSGTALAPPTVWMEHGPPFVLGMAKYADVNGDGMADLLYQGRTSLTGEGSKFWVSVSTGTSFAPAELWMEHGGPFVLAAQYPDVNGDGRADLVFQGGIPNILPLNGNTFWVSLSTGTDFGPPELWMTHGGGYLLGAAHYPDLNGDGMSDLIMQGVDNKFWVSISTGTGFSSPEMWIQHGGPFVLGMAQYADVNADGLADMVYQGRTSLTGEGSKFWVSLSTGTGFTPAELWMEHGGPFVLAAQYPDVNGDGRADLVFQGGTPNVLPLTGNTFWVSLSDGSDFGPAELWMEHGGEYLLGGASFPDVNGDGLADLIMQGSNNKFWVSLSTRNIFTDTPNHVRSTAYLVTSITDSLGGVTHISYKPMTDPTVYTKGTGAAYPKLNFVTRAYLVASVDEENGVGGTNQTTYHYNDAQLNLEGIGFLCFDSMSSTNQTNGHVTTTWFSQEFPYIGRPVRTETRLSDNTLLQEVDNILANIETFTGTYFPYIASSTDKKYEIDGTLLTTTETHQIFDDFGNPTLITAILQGAGETFITESVNIYTNDTTRWFLGRLTRSEITQRQWTHANGLVEENSTRVSSFEYDVNTGLLVKEILQPDLVSVGGIPTDFSRTTQNTYDAYGNKTVVTISGPDIATRSTTFEFENPSDPNAIPGLFTYKTINALGHTKVSEFNPGFVRITKLTGPNGLSTQWTVDGFGRQEVEIHADGTTITTTRAFCDANCPAHGNMMLITQESGKPPIKEITDVLGRKIRIETHGFDGTPIYTDTEYDVLGRVEKISRPYYAGDTPQWTVNTYDIVDRPIISIQPNGATTTVDYTGFSETITNDLDQENTRTLNARGELIRVLDAANNPTEYRYNPHGNLVGTQDPAGNIILLSYDVRGRKISMIDPDMGSWQYSYNALDQMVKQTDALGQVTVMDYDKLDRMISRTDDLGGSRQEITNWVFDTATKGIGKFHFLQRGGVTERQHTYDSLGRESSVITTIDGTAYAVSSTYDSQARLETVTYPPSTVHPAGLVVKNIYNINGYLNEVRNHSDDTSFWKADAMNAESQLTQSTLGNGLINTWNYNPQTGLVNTIKSGVPGVLNSVQDMSFMFDTLGNLKERKDHNQQVSGGPLTETFGYDNLNRMTSSQVTSQPAKSYMYNSIGNITFKTGVGTYHYGVGAGPHAVTSTDGITYTYDANGNMTGDNSGRSVVYSAFNKPVSITKLLATVNFTYGADRARIIQTNNAGRMVHYIGKLFEKETVPGGTIFTHYIRTGEGTAAIFRSYSTGESGTGYLHRDHLGSLAFVTGETGNLIESLSYDPHGKRRIHSGWLDGSASSSVTDRGFTGHEHMDSVGLIHMNGRVYDPTLGRFLSSDTIVQAPDNPQNLNRYSYVLNNPLSFTDPSGNFIFLGLLAGILAAFDVLDDVIEFIGDNIRTIGAIAFAIIASPIGGPFIAGFGAGLIASGGDIKAGLIGGFTAVAFNFLSPKLFSAFKGFKDVAKALAHGVVGGVRSQLQGGKFLQGFASASFNSFFGGTNNPLAAAVVGGTGSILGGGKFENGAFTSAFDALITSQVQSQHKFSELDVEDFNASMGAYNLTPDNIGDEINGWQVDDVIVGKDGFGAVVFRKSGNIKVAFRGTDSGVDWVSNLRQAFGFPSSQYKQAVDLAESFRGQNVHFTGHSLGGGLAATAANTIGASATTFNAAGLNNFYLKNVDRGGSITNYSSGMDILGVFNAILPTKAAGQQISVGIFGGPHNLSSVCRACN